MTETNTLTTRDLVAAGPRAAHSYRGDPPAAILDQ